MKRKNKIATYTLAALLLTTIGACTDNKQDAVLSDLTESPISFIGTVENNTEVMMGRGSTTINSNDNNYGEIYIWQQIDEGTPTISTYQASSGIQGQLETTSEGEKLKWQSAEATHNFYAWTLPDGVEMTEHDDPTTATVTFGTQNTEENSSEKKRDLEHFIVAHEGPVIYKEVGQYVELHFYRPVAKITLTDVIHILPDQSYEYIYDCTVTFPNLPATAQFNAIFDTGKNYNEKYPAVLTTTEENNNGITWEWEWNKEKSNSTIYLPPFVFKNSEEADYYKQPGYFIVEAKGNKYSGTLAEIQSPTELKGGDYMKMSLQVADGSVTGIYSYIVNWSTEGNQTVPQHRVPGIYTQEDAEALLEALQNEEEIPAYLVDIEGESQTIRFFTHVDWSNATSDIIIPEDYTLDGQGYYLKPDDITLYGKIENLYKQDGTQYKATEKPEEPDEDNTENSGDEGNEGGNNTGEDTTTSDTEDGTNP